LVSAVETSAFREGGKKKKKKGKEKKKRRRKERKKKKNQSTWADFVLLIGEAERKRNEKPTSQAHL